MGLEGAALRLVFQQCSVLELGTAVATCVHGAVGRCACRRLRAALFSPARATGLVATPAYVCWRRPCRCRPAGGAGLPSPDPRSGSKSVFPCSLSMLSSLYVEADMKILCEASVNWSARHEENEDEASFNFRARSRCDDVKWLSFLSISKLQSSQQQGCRWHSCK